MADKITNCLLIVFVLGSLFLLTRTGEFVDMIRQFQIIHGLELVESFNYAVSLPDYLK